MIESIREPRGEREAWSVLRARAGVRTRVGWEGGFRSGSEPNQTSRAALLVPGLALRRRWLCRGWTSDERALSASARTRVFTGTGEAAARPGGAPMIAPETGRRRTLR